MTPRRIRYRSDDRQLVAIVTALVLALEVVAGLAVGWLCGRL